MSNPKIHSKLVDGFNVRSYKDPSTIAGEWVVQVNDRTQRFNARRWTMKSAIQYLVDFEKMSAGKMAVAR